MAPYPYYIFHYKNLKKNFLIINQPSSKNFKSDSLRDLSVINSSRPVSFLFFSSSFRFFKTPISSSKLNFHRKNDSTVTLVPSKRF